MFPQTFQGLRNMLVAGMAPSSKSTHAKPSMNVYRFNIDHFTTEANGIHILWVQMETYRVFQKKQPSTGNHRDTLLTPATPNFNVVIGSAEHHQQKWLFFLKAAKHKLQKTTLNWGTGGAWPLWCGTSWDGCFFWRTRTQKRHNRMDPWLQTNARMMTTLCQRKHRDQFGRVFVCGCGCLLAGAHMC